MYSKICRIISYFFTETMSKCRLFIFYLPSFMSDPLPNYCINSSLIPDWINWLCFDCWLVEPNKTTYLVVHWRKCHDPGNQSATIRIYVLVDGKIPAQVNLFFSTVWEVPYNIISTGRFQSAATDLQCMFKLADSSYHDGALTLVFVTTPLPRYES